MACVYILHLTSSPEDIRYVGISKHDDPNKRLKKHLSNAQHLREGHVYNWIRKCLEEEKSIAATIVYANISFEEAKNMEIALIKQLKARGTDLTNMTDGGEGTLGLKNKPSAAARLKISLALKGRPSPMKGRSHSKDTRKKTSDALKGVPKTSLHKEKIAVALAGTKFTKERRDNISSSLTGRVLSEKHKENIRKGAAARRK